MLEYDVGYLYFQQESTLPITAENNTVVIASVLAVIIVVIIATALGLFFYKRHVNKLRREESRAAMSGFRMVECELNISRCTCLCLYVNVNV